MFFVMPSIDHDLPRVRHEEQPARRVLLRVGVLNPTIYFHPVAPLLADETQRRPQGPAKGVRHLHRRGAGRA